MLTTLCCLAVEVESVKNVRVAAAMDKDKASFIAPIISTGAGTTVTGSGHIRSSSQRQVQPYGSGTLSRVGGCLLALRCLLPETASHLENQVRRRLLLLLNGSMEARAGAAVICLIIPLITTQHQPPQVTETKTTYHSLMETTHPRPSFAQLPLLPPTPSNPLDQR